MTGENGYIGKMLKESLSDVELVSLKKNNHFSFLDNGGVDVLIHLAALVHKKGKDFGMGEYEKVNTSLTLDLAEKAKKSGVRHFIFFSTMAVYGLTEGEINAKTELNPYSFYGKSKLAAENALLKMQSENFKVSIIRPPMVYGPKCPGNYKSLRKLILMFPIFPLAENKRSMIFIGNLIEFVKQLLENRDVGIFHPQDSEYVDTTKMVELIAKVNRRKVYKSKLGLATLKLLIGKTNLYKKIFGDLYYDNNLSKYKDNSYQKYDLIEAIRLTEDN